jgi:UDPglucose--hexose-1-phosphate uridylyltransferase
MNLADFPHRRYNPLTGEWVLVSPHRTKRPWQGKIDQVVVPPAVSYDPKCFLCPGNQRAGNSKNPLYETTFAFDNDFAALIPDIPRETLNEQNLLVARGEQGRCRVVCHSPRHDLSFPLLTSVEICGVIDIWATEFMEAGSYDNVNYVLIFENRGEVMGATSAHPHSQIWATESIPTIPAAETAKQTEYSAEKNSCLLCDYVKLELAMQSRMIITNDSFVAVVPFWAVWPYEALVVPLEHYSDIGGMSKKARADFADILLRLTTRFDNLFSSPFPYSMGIHQRPTDGKDHQEWHLHAHFLSPLARSLSMRKLMAGFEILGMSQRDFTAEDAARKLRSCTEVHYTNQKPMQ